MTDAALKEALDAALAKLTDQHFAILIVGEIPPFGQQPSGELLVSTSCGSEQTREIIIKLAQGISNHGMPMPKEPPQA